MNVLELGYYAGCSLKRLFCRLGRKKLPFKVASVGNITVGGTGKTPAVIALASEAKQQGFRPCILTRGYRGTARGPCFVHDGRKTLLNAADAGDEALLMSRLLGDVAVVKGADRYKAGIFALRNLPPVSAGTAPSPLLFILDDGFQHWKLHRDVDILLIDSTNPFGSGGLLPLGTLREPLTEIARADIVILTKTDPAPQRPDTAAHASAACEELVGKVRIYNSAAPIFLARHEPASFKSVSGRELPLEAISGRSVVGFCGIANPSGFRMSLSRLGAGIRDFIAYRDHTAYTERSLATVFRRSQELGTDWIVTTEKDIIKLVDFDLPPNLVALHIEFRVDTGCYGEVFRRLQ